MKSYFSFDCANGVCKLEFTNNKSNVDFAKLFLDAISKNKEEDTQYSWYDSLKKTQKFEEIESSALK